MNVLEEICAKTRVLVKERKQSAPLHIIEQHAMRNGAARGFHAALKTSITKGIPALIAEIKKASPSKGIIRTDFNPAQHAADYSHGGASCLSVLTEPNYFLGSDTYLVQARKACSLPVLRKDFMVDAYQIAESKALGADCVLLIMAALDVLQARELESLAHSYGMDVLVEVHNRCELESALTYLSSRLIGINNRDLKAFHTSLLVTESLAPLIPKDYTVVCESGIYSYADIERIEASGVHAFLVGESLMRQTNVAEATRRLINAR